MKLNISAAVSFCFMMTLFAKVSQGEPVTAAVVVATTGVIVSGAGYAYCYFKECCNHRWTKHHKPNGLTEAFKHYLIGQHLVQKYVDKIVAAHLNKKQPQKALVLSFHGWTGSGKNFVADIIANHTYKKGTKSKFLHKYIAGTDFPHTGKLQEYKDRLKREIQEKTTACDRSMFVFDEIEKMPEGLIDVLKPFIDYHPHVNGIDYRRNIFIFLSNIGGEQINKETLKHFNKGAPREDITSRQMEHILSVGAFNLNGGLKNADIILTGLVDFFIPFLPMELEHVKQCVRAELQKQGIKLTDENEKIVNNVAKDLEYFPEKSPLFSGSGCKKVEKKLDAYL